MRIEEQELHTLMQRAVQSPEYRPKFLDALLTSQIYCLVDAEQPPTAWQEVENVKDFQKWESAQGQIAIPFFLSLDELKKSVASPQHYAHLATQVFFKRNDGHLLVLNPMSPIGKKFSSEEVQYLLAQQQAESILMAQPTEYPTKLVEALIAGFSNEIMAAYLGAAYEGVNVSPKIIIGLVCADEAKLPTLSSELLEKYQPQFVTIQQPLNIITEYLVNETEPFYQKG